MSGNGLSIERDGYHTRLKWHRLRRTRADPEFGFEALARGFELGASMELDLQVRGDGGFVVMHDNTLDRETSGSGSILAKSTADLEQLIYRQSNAPLTLSEDLGRLIQSAHPAALLQFDMKNDYAEIGSAGVDHLAALFADKAGSLIVSGSSTELIVAIGGRLPDIGRGIDPTDRLVAEWQEAGSGRIEALLREELKGPAEPHMAYLAWELILEAAATGLDLVAVCHDEAVLVDAWTFNMSDPSAGFSDEEWEKFSALMALGPDQVTTDEPLATETSWIARSAEASARG